MAGEITLEEGGSNPPTPTQQTQIRQSLGFTDENDTVPIDLMPDRARVMSEDGLYVLMRKFQVSDDGGVNYVEFSSEGVRFSSAVIVFFPTINEDLQQYYATTENADGSADYWRGSLASAPADPVAGWMYQDTTMGNVRLWSGTAWIDFS